MSTAANQISGATPAAGAMPGTIYPSGPGFAGYRLPFPGANAVLGPRDVGIWFDGEAGEAGGSGPGDATSTGSGSGNKGGAGSGSATDDPTLGDAGREAIRREREAARTEKERADKAEKELTELRAANQTEQEKATGEAVKTAVDAERAKSHAAIRAMRTESALIAKGMSPVAARDYATSSRFSELKVNDDLSVDGLDRVVDELEKAIPVLFSKASGGDVSRGPRHASSGDDQVRPGGDRLRNAYANSSKR